MAAATKVVKGTITTDGAGAGTANITTTGYRLRRVRVRNIDLTGGTLIAQDNAGAGTIHLASAAGTQNRKSTFVAPATVTSPLRITVAGGGATKRVRYAVELRR